MSAELFNMFLKESSFPDLRKVSSVVSIFKNVLARRTAENYNHVSFLSAFGKLFEKLVNNSLVDHLKKCDLFSEFQYGLRYSRSTVDLVRGISARIARAFNRSEPTQA